MKNSLTKENTVLREEERKEFAGTDPKYRSVRLRTYDRLISNKDKNYSLFKQCEVLFKKGGINFEESTHSVSNRYSVYTNLYANAKAAGGISICIEAGSEVFKMELILADENRRLVIALWESLLGYKEVWMNMDDSKQKKMRFRKKLLSSIPLYIKAIDKFAEKLSPALLIAKKVGKDIRKIEKEKDKEIKEVLKKALGSL